ncbi:50S ribosomal protein L13 [candidate division WWE3 bacterium RIFCSPLOWO2_01_FULL_39_13]|uniref:Large ribosomal subunit protein uL13 n=1 Tax=candidate division WWE3 bacterium RIFCSPLOWO2_01_FULL_39_13 TaxID=1802624 RepID=A0A1F4V4S0_UNCKA|nr:MAG: 50S ribosomal protein L13 [candidate division WWE3 bacterium RIFCSPLOWO2_01_FULL_39_13]
MKSHSTTKKELKIGWHHIDADGKVLGRISTDIVEKLMGKDKVNFVGYINCGDKVVVTNAKKVVLTGAKEDKKIYRTHTGRVGSLKELTARQVRAKNAPRMIFTAVKGMLPKNRLRKVRLANLYIYGGEENPHQNQSNLKKDA